jgi:hypothetical protein
MRILRSTFIGSNKRLVAVAQVGAHPDRRAVDHAVRPLAIARRSGQKRGTWWREFATHGATPRCDSMDEILGKKPWQVLALLCLLTFGK